VKFLIISNLYPPNIKGGYELAAFDIHNYLLSLGHEVKVLTRGFEQNKLINLDIERILVSPVKSALKPLKNYHDNEDYLILDNVKKINFSISEYKPDKILLFNLQAIGTAGILKYLEKSQIPIYYFVMDNVFKNFNKKSINHKEFEHRFGNVQIPINFYMLYPSKLIQMQLKESVNVATKNEYFHPCWVDRKKTKKKKVSTEKKRTFIFASRVSNHKGINLVIDAVEELINSSISNFKVDIFGDGDIASLMSNIQTRNLQGHINYVGNLNKADLLSRYRNYDSLLFPTWEIEAFGFVVVEAMSSGCIPIITKGIGATEWIVNNRGNIQIERTTNALIFAMARIINMKENELKEFSETAMVEAERFDTVSVFPEIYKTLMKKSKDTVSIYALSNRLKYIEKNNEPINVCRKAMWFLNWGINALNRRVKKRRKSRYK